MKKINHKNNPTKIYLFVDGSNLYSSQFDKFGPDSYLNFSKFIKFIQNRLDINFSKIYFYASYSPQKTGSKREKLYLKNESLFYKSVKNTPKCIFFKGYRSPTSGKEKEVDVKLAVDIVDMCHLNNYSQLFLISGDADFMHALVIAQKYNKKINIICLDNRIPQRFIYKFPTYCFTDKATFLPKNKLTYINTDFLKIISTTKNPEMHASRAC